jgi:glycerophosphoryl diester phosphodiesterase
MKLKKLYAVPGKTVVTAHRGFSGCFPENTMTAFHKAMELGVDIVEFDVRETLDGQLVILHDPTLDRTTNGSGPVNAKTWDEIRELNATYYVGPGEGGARHAEAQGDEGIPLFADVLESLAGRVGLNIQVYAERPDSLKKIVNLYLEHGLKDSAFLMLPTFAEAARIREMHSEIAICVGETREDLERHMALGVDFLQPRKSQLTDDYLRKIKATGIPFNVFYANSEVDMDWLIDRDVRGIMTDRPDRLLRTISLLSET